MPAILLDKLLDEDTSEELSIRLANQGHDVERVVNIAELGDGADDVDVQSYAERHERVVVTHDEGFFQRYEGKPGPLRLLWIVEQQGLEPYQKARMIENAVEILDEYQSPSDQPAAIALSRKFLY
jgi:predicted nuclease of predicted toxin-antitoxin system